jgi:hypothetical protein
MKLLAIFLGLVALYHIKKENEKTIDEFQSLKNKLIDVENLYSIIYTKPSNLTLNFSLTLTEQRIINEFTKIPGYTPRILGGWVRDKLLQINARDIDVVIDLQTIENLENFCEKLFSNINSTYPDLASNPKLFRSPYDKRNYGFAKTILFGFHVDISILAKEKVVVPPFVII